ncbi:uncharacterized protein [Drosophila bipectinata]|uniref:uncharacterized protein n=1 Tax=Drosophila bipectinata TaxID=42026 RepID=UPI001C89A46F|nr:uncharacterized protein LOC108130559 [Drosophila bipectinata]
MSITGQSHARDSDLISITKSAETDDNKIAMCVSLELARCRAENWQLKKKLIEYEVTIKNLEKLVATIASKQHQILNEVVELRKESRAASMADLSIVPALSYEMENSSLVEDDEEEDGYKADSDSGGSLCPSPRSSLASTASASSGSLCPSPLSTLALTASESSVASLTSSGLSSIGSPDNSDFISVSENDFSPGEATRSEEDEEVLYTLATDSDGD